MMKQIGRVSARLQYVHCLRCALALPALLMAAPAPGAADRQAYPLEVPPGMQAVQSREFDTLYVKPGFRPGDYGKLLIEEPQVTMDDDWQRNHRRALRGRDLERIVTGATKLLRAQFAGKLTSGEGYTLVETGPTDDAGTLRLRPSITELNLLAPDLTGATQTETWIRSAGYATLHLDLYDADSGELLLRVIDRNRARWHDRLYEANRATNHHDLRIMVSRWAGALRRHLDAMGGDA
jgi:hypothetical protein